MLCHQLTYRGYIIGMECQGSFWFTTASPKTPDLPIMDCFNSKATAKSETEALAEVKSWVDRKLLEAHRIPS
jgi:hypothetical protein